MGRGKLMTANVEDAVWRRNRVWEVERVGLERVLSQVRARGSAAGRPALPLAGDALGLGLAEGIVSARALARRCETDLACRWALGGRTVSHHTLSDFLRQDCGTLDALLSQTVSALQAGRCRLTRSGRK